MRKEIKVHGMNEGRETQNTTKRSKGRRIQRWKEGSLRKEERKLKKGRKEGRKAAKGRKKKEGR